jgi:hypothetical protein
MHRTLLWGRKTSRFRTPQVCQRLKLSRTRTLFALQLLAITLRYSSFGTAQFSSQAFNLLS